MSAVFSLSALHSGRQAAEHAAGESLAFRHAIRLLLPKEAWAGIAHFVDEHAFTDAAIALIRHALPDHGFKITLPPPLPDGAGAQAFATAWRRGEAQAMAWHAATPAIALLRAAEGEYAAHRDSQSLAACCECHGLGWYVTRDGAKQMCRHSGM